MNLLVKFTNKHQEPYIEYLFHIFQFPFLKTNSEGRQREDARTPRTCFYTRWLSWSCDRSRKKELKGHKLSDRSAAFHRREECVPEWVTGSQKKGKAASQSYCGE